MRKIATDRVCRARQGLQCHRGIARIEKTIQRRAISTLLILPFSIAC
jgi:hypothetical protein